MRKLEFVDALRGVAILAVVSLHSSEAVAPASPILARLMSEGTLGVQLFYVMSAITLGMSWDSRSNRESSPVRNFFLRRAFRIVPMFYVAIILYLCTRGLAANYWAPDGIKWSYVLLTATFLNGFHPETINSVVPGGWSIAVEMTFYAFLPLILMRLTSWQARCALLAASIAFHFLWKAAWMLFYSPMYPPEQQYLVGASAYCSFFFQLPIFATGLLAYLAFRDQTVLKTWVIIGNCVLLLSFAVLPWRLFSAAVSHNEVMSFIFALAAMTLACYPTRLVCNRVVILLGQVSFSLYLVHFAVLDLLSRIGVQGLFARTDLGSILYLLCVLALSGAVSYVCYRTIELPGIALGKHLIRHLDGVASPRPAHVHEPEY
jgi:peptidoglycan/LPS O-acetylase OafA/YrhL